MMGSQNRARLYYRLGDLRGRQGRWKESAAYFAKGLEVEPDPLFFDEYHYYLPALVRSGNLAAYQQARQELFRRFGNTSDPRIAEITIKDCLFIPWPDADFDNLERLANTAMHAEDHWASDYFHFAKGLLEYRRGNYELAVWHTQRANLGTDYYLLVPASIVRAMALYQLGELEQARALLCFGLEHAHASFPREAQLMRERIWNDWTIAHALMDEASALIDRRVASVIPKTLATCRHPIAAVENLYLLALEKLRAGDEAGYQNACAVLALVPDCGGQIVPEFRRAWTWCLGSNRAEDLTTPLKRAEQIVANKSLDAHHVEHLVLGATLYRIGRYESAAQHLESSIAAYPSRPHDAFGTVIYPQLLLSMVKSRLGANDEARRLFAEIRPGIKAARESPPPLWQYRTTIEILYREAESLIGQMEVEKTVVKDRRAGQFARKR
jgi:tetratricopeptide (TPR) repeat protein